MFNVGSGELLVILLIALIVLGPTKLPEVARQVGSVAKELRRMSTSFQAEMKAALDEPTEAAARERGNKVVSSEIAAAPDVEDAPTDSTPQLPDETDQGPATEPEEPQVSTAEAAGMYDMSKSVSYDRSAATKGVKRGTDPSESESSKASADSNDTGDPAS